MIILLVFCLFCAWMFFKVLWMVLKWLNSIICMIFAMVTKKEQVGTGLKKVRFEKASGEGQVIL